jgi:uncharacterized membrane-anchored protein YitT (DUF2179 family)
MVDSKPSFEPSNPKPRKKKKWEYIRKYLFMFIGSIISAAGLEMFLVPNNIIDGGVVGIAIMASYVTGQSIGLFLVLLNLPFLYLGYKQIGKTFAISTTFAICSLAFWTNQFHPVEVVTHDLFLATIFGGILVGLGVGMIIRSGGSLDGTEIVAIIFDKRSGFSVGEIVMFINLFILSSAGLVFSWDKAMYSLVAYFIIAKMMDTVIAGIDESKAIMIVSSEPDEIADALMARLGRGVTILHGEGGYSGESKKVLYCVITRLEVEKMKEIVMEKDDSAFVTINEVHDIMGGRFKKKAIH